MLLLIHLCCAAEQYGGRILVARESAAAPGKNGGRNPFGADDQPLDNPTGELVDMWEPIKGPDAVQTPAEVYNMLAREGLAVRYLRVPVTDGKAPQPCDVDAIVEQVRGLSMLRGALWAQDTEQHCSSRCGIITTSIL